MHCAFNPPPPIDWRSPVAKTMTKSATVAYLAEKTSLSRKQIEGFLDETLNLASKEAKKSGVFLLPGFGKLVLANRKARMGRNPQTGEPIKIPAKRVCKFRLAKSLKDAVLGGKK
jgi:DNA-binding protein HU-beta